MGLTKKSIGETDNELELAYNADQILTMFGGRLPSAADLQVISQESGPKLATMVLYRALLAHPRHGGFIRQVNRTVPTGQLLDRRPATALIVAERPWLQAAIRKTARDCGFSTEIAPTDRRLSLSENARRIRAALADPAVTGDVVVVSAGRGTLEFRMLVQKAPQSPELARIKAWVNVMGDFHGSEAATRALASPGTKARAFLKCRLSGRSFMALKESDKRFEFWRNSCPLLKQTLMVSLVGIPLKHHLPADRRKTWDSLAPTGPNDGYGLLSDMIANPGLVYPVWGVTREEDWAVLAPYLARILGCVAKAQLKVAEIGIGPIEPAAPLTASQAPFLELPLEESIEEPRDEPALPIEEIGEHQRSHDRGI